MSKAVLRHLLFVGQDPALWIAARHAEAAGGISVTVCASGGEAALRLAELAPDLVLLDAAAPGLESLATRPETPEGREIPLVVLAGAGEGEEPARRLGATALLEKPLEPAEIDRRLRDIWEILATAPWILDKENRVYQRQFLTRLPIRVEEVEEAWRRVQASGWSGESMILLHRLAHSLAGAGAMFGLADVAAAAREMEHLARGPAAPGEAAIRRIETLMGELRRAARQTF
jgi:CheY-like chemotaxis protein